MHMVKYKYVPFTFGKQVCPHFIHELLLSIFLALQLPLLNFPSFSSALWKEGSSHGRGKHWKAITFKVDWGLKTLKIHML